jgi:tetratricopeptide (TPR) repeat protein/DNA-binding XRE family transcriptional regulator
VTDDGDTAMADDATAAGAVRRQRLAHRRKALGLTQEDLAGLLGVERSTVVRWERGETEPMPWIWPKLAKALRVSPERLDELLRNVGPGGAARPDAAGDPAGPARDSLGQGGVVPAVPRQLPATVADFTGRAAEIETLTRLLKDTGETAPGTVVISAIGGTAGVGKTALALHWAHQVAGRFGDGQLYVNLRGFDPTGAPASPAEAVRAFLDTLGVPAERIPPAQDAQAGLYRSMLADRKMLIVLDNARDEQQVRPLLPASPASLVLVTSRNQLTGLVAADGARLVSLDVLPHDEAVQLLTARIGHARTAAEPDAADEIATLCACLPLALAVAAARAAARPGFPLTALVGDLRDTAGRLDALDAGDPAASVRAVFSWSYSQLTPGAARMFRLLGLHPGPDISTLAAASLAATSEPEARRLLGEVARAQLVAERVPGRYASHDLLRAYAAAQARDSDTETDRRAATGRILDHYLHTAHAASLLLRPGRIQVALAAPKPGTAPERIADHRQALAWFEAEHHVLLAAVTLAESSSGRHAWQLPWGISPFLQVRGYYQDWAVTQRTALDAATRLDDTEGQAASSRLLATACQSLGDYDHALGYLTTSLELCRRLGDRRGEASVLGEISFVAEHQGRYAVSLEHREQALRLHRAVGNREGEVELLNNIGMAHVRLGNFERARASCLQALALNEEVGSRHVDGYIWDSLGYVEHHLGNFSEAIACYERALGIVREFVDRALEAEVLTHLGDARHASGRPAQAREAWQQALAILDELGHPDADQVRAKLASLDGRDPGHRDG